MNKTPSTNMNKIDKAMKSMRPTNQRGAVRYWWLWLLLVILAGAGGYYYYQKQSDSDSAKSAGADGSNGGHGGKRGGARSTMAVAVPAVAKTGDINVYLNGLGTVTPVATVTVKTHVSGTLMKVMFTEGQNIKEGQLLAVVDPRPYQVQLELAEGTMAHDAALLKNARVDLVRYQTLYKQDSIQEQQLTTQDALVHQYEAQIKVDQAGIDAQKLNLVYCNITSPITGRVGLRQVDPGNIVNPGDTTGIVVITQLQPITVVFALPEDNIPGVVQKLQAGIKMPVDTFDRSQNQKLATGTLLTLDNLVNSSTGTVNLKAEFSNEKYTLFPSQFVNARLLLDVKHNATIIPSAGVQRGSQGTYVYVINADRTVSLRLVKVGITEGDNSSIDSGLNPGETVVIDGADKLRDGLKVEVAGMDNNSPNKNAAAGAAASEKADATNNADDAASASGNASANGDKSKKGRHHRSSDSDS